MTAQPTPTSKAQALAPLAAVLRCQNPETLNDTHCLEIRLGGSEVLIGRGSGNHAVLQAYGISRRHARLYAEHGAWHVEDLGSTNGTRVNHQEIRNARLNEGDSVAFGRVVFTFNRDAHIQEDIRDTSADVNFGLGDKTVPIRPEPKAAGTAQTADPREADTIRGATTAARRVQEIPRRSIIPALAVSLALLLLAAGGYLLLR